MFKLKCAFFRGTLPAESPEYPYIQFHAMHFKNEDLSSIHATLVHPGQLAFTP